MILQRLCSVPSELDGASTLRGLGGAHVKLTAVPRERAAHLDRAGFEIHVLPTIRAKLEGRGAMPRPPCWTYWNRPSVPTAPAVARVSRSHVGRRWRPSAASRPPRAAPAAGAGWSAPLPAL